MIVRTSLSTKVAKLASKPLDYSTASWTGSMSRTEELLQWGGDGSNDPKRKVLNPRRGPQHDRHSSGCRVVDLFVDQLVSMALGKQRQECLRNVLPFKSPTQFLSTTIFSSQIRLRRGFKTHSHPLPQQDGFLPAVYYRQQRQTPPLSLPSLRFGMSWERTIPIQTLHPSTFSDKHIQIGEKTFRALPPNSRHP